MANKTASLGISLVYTGPAGEVVTRPAETLAAAYQAESVDLIDVPDLEAMGTEHPVSFGSIGVGASLMLLKNRTGQDLEMHLNGAPPSETGTLVAGTKTIAMVVGSTGDLRVVAGANNGGTPGILSARKSGGNVIVESWLAGTGIQALDISDFTVYDDGAVVPNLPNNALAIVAMAALPAAGKLTSCTLKTTAAQTGAGTIETRVFGDPT